MIICICNALNTEKVEAAIANGADTYAKVMKHNDCRPNCGQCKPEICDLLAKHQQPKNPAQ